MRNRIGSLHVEYRADSRSPAAAAMAPQLDRLLTSRLGEALDERIAPLLGGDVEVVVIRDLHVRARVRPEDWSLDSRLLETIGRASASAIGDALAAPPHEDQIIRFASQAEFIGSFIIDLLGRSAWDRWYFGAFQSFRQADDRETIEAILADNREHVAGAFGWLARRGHLDALLALLGAARARRLFSSPDTDGAEVAELGRSAALIAAGFQILDVLGWASGDAEVRSALATRYVALQPVPPTWTDRRSLSAWVLRFVHFVAEATTPRASRRPAVGQPLPELLAGTLDWLDLDWLAPRLTHLAGSPAPSSAPTSRSSRRVLTSQHERALDRLADLLRLGSIRLLPDDEVDAVFVRLMAALGEPDVAGEPDGALAAAINRIAKAFVAAVRSGVNGDHVRLAIAGKSGLDSTTAASAGLVRLIDDVTDLGPSAERALQYLVASTMAREPIGEPTSAGGLFLLTRVLVDVRLHTMAREAGVPFDSLKAALAAWWLDLSPPFDGGATVWVGETPSEWLALDASAAAVRSLEDALLEVLRNQRAFDALPAEDAIEPEPRAAVAPGASDDVRRAIARIGWMLLRAWSRWLPGIGQSQRPFLVDNCLRRGARVHVTPSVIGVQLDPAPLDVVLEMAGYFRPIERVAWLDGRTMTFSVRRQP